MRKIKKLITKTILLAICLHLHAPGINSWMRFAGHHNDTIITSDYRAQLIDLAHVELQERLSRAVKQSEYRRYRYWTYCNVFAADFLDNRPCWITGQGFLFSDYGYDVSKLYPIPYSVRNTRIEVAYARALSIKHLTGEQAFYEAQLGTVILVISRRYNHMAIVYPEYGRYPANGCLVAQAGWYNGIFRISDPEVFGKNWKDKEILYLMFKIRR
jgi:hypothetical protein